MSGIFGFIRNLFSTSQQADTINLLLAERCTIRFFLFATRCGKDSNKIRYSISHVDLYTICMKKLNFLHSRHLPSAELDDDLFVAVAHVLKCVTPLTVESHRVETIFISSLQN